MLRVLHVLLFETVFRTTSSPVSGLGGSKLQEWIGCADAIQKGIREVTDIGSEIDSAYHIFDTAIGDEAEEPA